MAQKKQSEKTKVLFIRNLPEEYYELFTQTAKEERITSAGLLMKLLKKCK
jgi:hypothetical protein